MARLPGPALPPTDSQKERLIKLARELTLPRMARSASMVVVLAGALIIGSLVSPFASDGMGVKPEEPALVQPQQHSEMPAATAMSVDSVAPTPVPTRTPGPVPAARLERGPASRLTNPSSLGFPAPAPAVRTSPPNAAGVVRIVSPDLGLDHYIDTLGITGGHMQSPDGDGMHAVGWYAPDATYALGTPGHEGNAMFSAHETWLHQQGPFYWLHQARVGDSIFLDMSDGTRREYQVIRLTRYPAYSMPMDEVVWPSDRPAEEEWLTLIPAAGGLSMTAQGTVTISSGTCSWRRG